MALRLAFALVYLIVALATGVYPPQGTPGGNFTAGGDSVFDSIVLDQANQDVVVERGPGGVCDVNATPGGLGDGALRSYSIYTKTPYGAISLLDDCFLKFGSAGDVWEQGELTTLAHGSPSTVFSIVTNDGANARVGGDYTISESDGTENGSESGRVTIALLDESTGVTASTPGEVSSQALSSGSMTSDWTVDTSDDTSVEVKVNATVTGWTPLVVTIRWKATYSGNVYLTVP